MSVFLPDDLLGTIFAEKVRKNKPLVGLGIPPENRAVVWEIITKARARRKENPGLSSRVHLLSVLTSPPIRLLWGGAPSASKTRHEVHP
jgi:hypothetical protein